VALGPHGSLGVKTVRLSLLILFAERLDVGFAVGVEEVLLTSLPRGLELGSSDVPVGAAFFADGAEVLAKIFHGGPAEEPVAIVNLVNDKAGLEDNHMRDHGIVERIGVFGDAEVFLDGAARVGEEWPVGVDAGAIFIRLADTVGADGDEAAIGDFEFTMELDEEFRLAAVLGAETSAAEDENHGMLCLQFGELLAFAGMVGKFVIGKDGAGNDVRSHRKTSYSRMPAARIRFTIREMDASSAIYLD
jgi:hypothetical protein